MTTWLHRILAPTRGRTATADPEAAEALDTARIQQVEAAETLAEARQVRILHRAVRHENHFGARLDALLKGNTA